MRFNAEKKEACSPVVAGFTASLERERTRRKKTSELRSDAQGGALCHWDRLFEEGPEGNE
jgi:hypothetical protein